MLKAMRATWAIQKLVSSMVHDHGMDLETAKYICHPFLEKHMQRLIEHFGVTGDWNESIYEIASSELEGNQSLSKPQRTALGFISASSGAKSVSGIVDERAFAVGLFYELSKKFDFVSINGETTLERDNEQTRINLLEEEEFIASVIQPLVATDKFVNGGVIPDKIILNDWLLGFMWGLAGQLGSHDLKLRDKNIPSLEKFNFLVTCLAKGLTASKPKIQGKIESLLKNKTVEFEAGMKDGIYYHKRITYAQSKGLDNNDAIASFLRKKHQHLSIEY